MAAYRGNDYYRGLAVVDRCCEEAAKKGWSSYALGKKTFRNATQWSNIVGSARTPKIGTLNKIAAALDVSVAYLLSGCSCDYGRYKPCRVNLRRLLELPRRHGLDDAHTFCFRKFATIYRKTSVCRLFSSWKASLGFRRINWCLSMNKKEFIQKDFEHGGEF